MSESDISLLDDARSRGYRDGGFRIYDISQRQSPRLMHHHKTFGFGVHRFDVDEQYAYMSTEMEGNIGNILVIYDMRDPARPEEVGHFIPEPVAGQSSPQSNDVDVDDEGLIYLIDRNVGFDILELRR